MNVDGKLTINNDNTEINITARPKEYGAPQYATPVTTKPAQDIEPMTLRSKSALSVKAKDFQPSPFVQVDGPLDNMHVVNTPCSVSGGGLYESDTINAAAVSKTHKAPPEDWEIGMERWIKSLQQDRDASPYMPTLEND